MSQLPNRRQGIIPIIHKKENQKLSPQNPKVLIAIPLLKNTKVKESVDNQRIVPATHKKEDQKLKLEKSTLVAIPLFKHVKIVNSSSRSIKPAIHSNMEFPPPELKTGEVSIPPLLSSSKDAVQQITSDLNVRVTGNVVLQESVHQPSNTTETESLSVEQLDLVEPDSATSSKTQYHDCRQLAASSPSEVLSATVLDWSNIAIATEFAELICSGNNMASLTTLDFSDCMLELQLGPITHILPLHTTTIITNGTFARLVAQSREQGDYDQYGRVKIKMHSNAVGLTHDIAIGAIRTLYGALPSEILDKYFDAQEHPDNRNIALIFRMATTIRFFFAGDFFKIEPVVKTALRIIKEELNFDNLEFAITSALFGTAHISDHNPYDHEFLYNFLHGTFLELGTSLYGYRSEEILIACLEFLVENFPEAYSFDPSVLVSLDLGGVFLDEDESVSNLNPTRPRPGTLQAIEFGSFTAIVRHHDLISTILLSAPFPILAYLYRRLSERYQFIDLEKILCARTSRYQRRIHSAIAARAEILEMQSMGEEIPPEFFGRAFIPDRALWSEEYETNEQGEVEAVRTWLGDSGIHAV